MDKYHFWGITNINNVNDKDKRIESYSYKGLNAILYPVTFSDIDMADKNNVVFLLKDFQGIMENLRPYGTVLPFQLTTLSFDIEEIEKILSNYYVPLNRLLFDLYEKEEFEVQVRWNNIEHVLKQISTSQEFVSAMQNRLGDKEKKQVQIEDKIFAGKLLANAMEEKRQKITEETAANIGPYTSNFKSLPVTEEQIAAHISFLVDKSKENTFHEVLDKFSESGENDQLLKFRVIGPLVPYNFATVSLTYLNNSNIENYKAHLELPGNFLSEDELKTNIRRLALKYHPDKDKSNEEKFKEIINAYKTFSSLITMEPNKTIDLDKYKDRYVLTIPNIDRGLVTVNRKDNRGNK